MLRPVGRLILGDLEATSSRGDQLIRNDIRFLATRTHMEEFDEELLECFENSLASDRWVTPAILDFKTSLLNFYSKETPVLS